VRPYAGENLLRKVDHAPARRLSPPLDWLRLAASHEEEVSVSPPPTVTQKGEGGRTPTQVGATAAGVTSVPIPLCATEWVTLQGDFPLSEGAWGQLLRVLEVMKPGLVVPHQAVTADDDAGDAD
jgi:hypothetical protein